MSDNPSMPLTKWQIIYRGLVVCCGFILAFGEFKDAKDLGKESFEWLISNFTHSVEYKKLDNLHIGITAKYLQSKMGYPKVVKPSKQSFGMTFEYYFHKKYLLTAFMKGKRLSCYSLLALAPDFKPEIPFSKHQLQSLSMGELIDKPVNEYVNDVVNINYFLQQQFLGKTGLYMNRTIGVIRYDGKSIGLVDNLNQLEKALIHDNKKTEKQVLERLNKNHSANFYAVCESSLNVVAEAVLTSYEYLQLK